MEMGIRGGAVRVSTVAVNEGCSEKRVCSELLVRFGGLAVSQCRSTREYTVSVKLRKACCYTT